MSWNTWKVRGCEFVPEPILMVGILEIRSFKEVIGVKLGTITLCVCCVEVLTAVQQSILIQ